MSTHRPLSDWVARVTSQGLGPINDSAERSDARTFSIFAHNWIRSTAVISDPDGHEYHTLALRHPASGTTVVELDDYGRPLEISANGAALVDEIEQSWPQIQLSDADLDVFATQSKAIRYFLLLRLAAEGDPPPKLFHVLPWDAVEDAADTLTTLLQGGHTDDPVDLRHWVTPAVVGVTGPMEQLYEGLTSDDSTLIRLASTSLCEGLRVAPVERIPAATAARLVTLIDQIASNNPFLKHTAAAVHALFSGHREDSFSVELSSELPKAASTQQNRFYTEHLADDSPLTVDIRVTAAGRLIITVEFAIPADNDRDQLVGEYGLMFQPVMIRVGGGAQRYWVAMRERRRGLSGNLELRAPANRFLIEADQPPVGVAEISSITADELLPSLRAADNAGREAWTELANRLPVEHPVTVAIRRLRAES